VQTKTVTQKFGLVIPTPKPSPVPTPKPTPKGSSLIDRGGWHFWAVDTDSTADAGVKAACLAKGLLTPCAGKKNCQYNSHSCIVTSETGCGRRMNDLAKALVCNLGLYKWQQLAGVYTYMGENYGGGAFGCQMKGNAWIGCLRGKSNKAGKALFVQKGKIG